MKKKRILMGFFVLSALVGIGVLGYAFFPSFSYVVSQNIPGLQDEKAVPDASLIESDDEMRSQENVLVIDKIGVHTPISEGGTDYALELGAWRYPSTATPLQRGNMVITAHRFKFLPPHNKTFYLLDKLEVGDEVRVYWEGQEYAYQVSESYEVEADQMDVLEKGNERMLTLMTCTPMFTQDKRLIIKAMPIS